MYQYTKTAMEYFKSPNGNKENKSGSTKSGYNTNLKQKFDYKVSYSLKHLSIVGL